MLAQVALNLTAPILLTRAALPALRGSGDGLVVNVSSGIALIGMPFYTTYAATKAGIAHFGEALRRELYGEGVHVLNVFPGATSTPMMETSKAGAEHGFDYESPEEVAAATIVGITDGSLAVIRGGETRAQMIALNRNDPAAATSSSTAASPNSSGPSPATPACNPFRRSSPSMTASLFSPYRLGQFELPSGSSWRQ